jgi:hypothetical protein
VNVAGEPGDTTVTRSGDLAEASKKRLTFGDVVEAGPVLRVDDGR